MVVNIANSYLQNAAAIMPKNKDDFKTRLAVFDVNGDGKVTKSELDGMLGTKKQDVLTDINSYNRYTQIQTNLTNLKNNSVKLGMGRFAKVFDILLGLVNSGLNNIANSLTTKAEQFAVGTVAQGNFTKFAGAAAGGNGASIDLNTDLTAMASQDNQGSTISQLDIDLFGAGKASQATQDWMNLFKAADTDGNNDVTSTEISGLISSKQGQLNAIMASATPDVATARQLRNDLATLGSMATNRDVLANVSGDPMTFGTDDIQTLANSDGDGTTLTGGELYKEARGPIDSNKYIAALAQADDVNGGTPSKAQLLSYVDQSPDIKQLLADFGKDTPEFASAIQSQIRSINETTKIAQRIAQNFSAFDANKNGVIDANEIAAKADASGLITDAQLGITNPFGVA